jgi:hypothetical protein
LNKIIQIILFERKYWCLKSHYKKESQKNDKRMTKDQSIQRMTKEFKSFVKYTLFILFERKISKTNQRIVKRIAKE